MRRKPGGLVPLELDICVAAFRLNGRGIDEFHGYQLAKMLKDGESHRLLTAYGTLYRALGRLESMGLLASRWEDPATSARESRPARRLYSLTAAGSAAVVEARRAAGTRVPARIRRRIVPA